MSLQTLLAITPVPALSVVLLVVLAVAVLYLARGPAHNIILTICEALAEAMRFAGQAVTAGEKRLMDRNHEVLLAAGREAKERIIEREFDRVAASVQKDLAAYPGLQRTLSEAITRIEEDHQAAAEVPPSPPGWVKAVEAVAKLNVGRDESVGPILADIHVSLVKAQEQVTDDYRAASRRRHTVLQRMLPRWRRIQQTLNHIGKDIDTLLERSRSIDRHIEEYEEVVRGTDRAVQVLSSSSLVHFFVSLIVLGVAVGGAAINFSLIARPMAEMVGGTNFIGGFRTADIAALVIIMVEISMGLFLMESMRITRLFPVVGALPDKVRMRMIAVTFTILFLLATVEAGLAYMREILMQDELATSAILRGGEVLATSEYSWITTAAQMGMGFTLPFALVFVAIPLETFVHSFRTVLGVIGIGVMRFLRLVLTLVGNLFSHAGKALTRVYDLPIVLPLWIEAKWRKPGDPGPFGKRREKNPAEVSL